VQIKIQVGEGALGVSKGATMGKCLYTQEKSIKIFFSRTTVPKEFRFI
jgi:hypothetical protein